MRTKGEIGKEFDTWAEGYTELMERIVPYYQMLQREVFERLPSDFHAEAILDLGSGNGNMLAWATLVFPQAHFIAVDASEDMLAITQKRFPNQAIELHHRLIQEVTVPAASVDLVMASFSMHHLDNEVKRAVIQRSANWLKPGGYFLYCDLMVEEGSAEHEELIEGWRQFVLANSDQAEWEWLIDHHRQYDRVATERDLVTNFHQAGYRYVQSYRHEIHWVAMLAQV